MSDDRSDEDRQLRLKLGIARFAEALGEDGDKVFEEMQGNTALARLVRKMFDLDAPPVSRGGRPPDDNLNWALWRHVRLVQARGGKITKATEEWAERAEAEGLTDERAKEFEALKKRWGRIEDFWSDSDAPQSLADLFKPIPPKRND